MSNAVKYVPWALVAGLSVALGAVWFNLNEHIKQQDADLLALSQKYDQLSNDSFQKLNAAKQNYEALAAEANQKIAEAGEKYQELEASASQQIEMASLPEAQVRISFRKALLSSGNVAKITNIATGSIAVTAEVERPSTGRKKAYELTLDTNQYKEIGELEGWAFVSGDVITIRQAGHKVLTFTSS